MITGKNFTLEAVKAYQMSDDPSFPMDIQFKDIAETQIYKNVRVNIVVWRRDNNKIK